MTSLEAFPTCVWLSRPLESRRALSRSLCAPHDLAKVDRGWPCRHTIPASQAGPSRSPGELGFPVGKSLTPNQVLEVHKSKFIGSFILTHDFNAYEVPDIPAQIYSSRCRSRPLRPPLDRGTACSEICNDSFNRRAFAITKNLNLRNDDIFSDTVPFLNTSGVLKQWHQRQGVS